MGKLNEHRIRINSQIQISKSRIEKGMVLRVRYSPITSILSLPILYSEFVVEILHENI